jgi:hypothetical protein
MDVIRKELRHQKQQRGGGGGKGKDNDEYVIQIHPGQVQEAAHKLQHPGEINLTELRFKAVRSSDEGDDDAFVDFEDEVFDRNHRHHGDNKEEEVGLNINTYIDIAIFEVPNNCNSQTCDLPDYGVGTLEHYNGIRFLNLCDNGRLKINHDLFVGHHIELPVAKYGPMKTDRLDVEESEIFVPTGGRTFEVMIANCNKQGREINLFGQVVFDSILLNNDGSINGIDIISEIHLVIFALAVCLFFTLCTVRIHLGTRADYTYARLTRNTRISNLVSTEPQEVEELEAQEGRDDGGGDHHSITLHPIQIV